jgi:hypothetical protein
MANSTNGASTPPTDGRPVEATAELAVNGVKLLGEAIIPGASLLVEKHVGAGLLATATAVLGGAGLGALMGPFGYILARYGASAASYWLSVQPPPPANGTTTRLAQSAINAAQEATQALRAFRTQAAPATQGAFAQAPASQAQAFAQPQAPAGQAQAGDPFDAFVRGVTYAQNVVQSLRNFPTPPPSAPPTPPQGSPQVGPDIAALTAERVAASAVETAAAAVRATEALQEEFREFRRQMRRD